MEKKTNNEEIEETPEARYRNIGMDLVDCRYELKAAFDDDDVDVLEQAVKKYVAMKAKFAAAQFLAERA